MIVCPLHAMDDAVARWRPSHVVSLASPGVPAVTPPDGCERLWLVFHDIAEERPGLVACGVDDVARLLAFGRAWDGCAPLLIQCWAGVSRSPAAAYAIACARAAAGDEGAIADLLRQAAPFATPNARMVAIADTLLGRQGRMVSSIRAIGRGAETSLGTTFVVPRTGFEPV